MKTIKIKWSNGNEQTHFYSETNINGTKEEIEKYYLNRVFNLGSGENDKMVKCIGIEFVQEAA